MTNDHNVTTIYTAILSLLFGDYLQRKSYKINLVAVAEKNRNPLNRSTNETSIILLIDPHNRLKFHPFGILSHKSGNCRRTFQPHGSRTGRREHRWALYSVEGISANGNNFRHVRCGIYGTDKIFRSCGPIIHSPCHLEIRVFPSIFIFRICHLPYSTVPDVRGVINVSCYVYFDLFCLPKTPEIEIWKQPNFFSALTLSLPRTGKEGVSLGTHL